MYIFFLRLDEEKEADLELTTEQHRSVNPRFSHLCAHMMYRFMATN